MRKQLVLGTLALFFLTTAGICGAAEDSVTVDLSVLDQLSPAPSAPEMRGKPMFPVVKKKPAAPRKARAAKIIARPHAKVKVTRHQEQPQIRRPEPMEKENKLLINAPEAAPALPPLPAKPEMQPRPIAPVVAAITADGRPAPLPEAAKAQPAVQPEAPVAPASSVNAPAAPLPPASLPPALPADNTSAVPQVVSAPSVVPTEETVEVVDVEPALKIETEAAQAPAAEAAVAADKEPLLILDQKPVPELPKSKVSSLIRFEPESDELTADRQIQIDRIIASFKDPHNNKIAISAFNFDDGVDSFRKKRLSLNRAVEIRSYLLQKGYKNFSIKVVNVDSASGKANVVAVEEK